MLLDVLQRSTLCCNVWTVDDVSDFLPALQSPILAQQLFPDPSRLTVSSVLEKYSTLRPQLVNIQSAAAELIKKMLVASPEARERVLLWTAKILAANVA